MEEQNIVDVVENDTPVPAEPEVKQAQDEKKYTDAEVDAIIDKKFAKWKAEQEAKEAEDKKFSKMNDLEKAEHEKQKLLDQIKSLEDEKTLFNMTNVGYTLEVDDFGTKLLVFVNALFALLTITGIVNDPTTTGLSDSENAMTYDEPQ